MEQIIKTSTYTVNFPYKDCIIKVAIKPPKDYHWEDDCFKTNVFEDAIYKSGFVSIDDGKTYYLASNFLFHKLKRKYI